MVHNNKRYSEEFKKQIVNLHLSGKSVKALANEYGLVEQTIYKCIHHVSSNREIENHNHP